MSNPSLPAPVIEPTGQLYRIHLDAESKIIWVNNQGFWSVEVAERYVVDMGKFIDASQRAFGFARILSDRRSTEIQTAEVAAVMQKLLGRYGEEDRLATVVDSSLSRMQAQRVLARNGMQVFKDLKEAEAWLTSGS